MEEYANVGTRDFLDFYVIDCLHDAHAVRLIDGVEFSQRSRYLDVEVVGVNSNFSSDASF